MLLLAACAHAAAPSARLVLAGLAAVAAASSSSGAPPRGVPRSLFKLYEGAQFTCLDGVGSLPSARVNDDYCDCADGSDEPGTAACGAAGRFHCANRGARSRTLAASLVNDGVCDCCDGSDEWGAAAAGQAVCANTCEADGAEWRRAQAEAIRKAEAGAAARALYAAEGAAAAAGRAQRTTAIAAELEKATADKARADAVSASDGARARRGAARCSQGRRPRASTRHHPRVARRRPPPSPGSGSRRGRGAHRECAPRLRRYGGDARGRRRRSAHWRVQQGAAR